MSKELLIFGDNGTNKRKFLYSKYPIGINNVEIDKILIPNKVSLGKRL